MFEIRKNKKIINGEEVLCYFGNPNLTKEDALVILEDCYKSYTYTPYPKRTSIRNIVRKLEKKDIYIDRATLSRYLEYRGAKLRDVRPQRANKIPATFTIDKELMDLLNDYPNKSYITNLGIQLVLGIPIADAVVFPDETTSVIFRFRKNGNIQAIINGELTQRDKTQIKTVLNTAKENGIQAIVDYANINGYKMFGGNL